MIEKMVALLREEEASDINHRDRCQNAENANQNSMSDLDHDIEKTGESLGRMADEEKDLQTQIETLEASIKETETEMKEMLDNRNEEDKKFKQALKDDTDAVELLDKAITSLSAFYKRNKIPLELAQKKAPEYSVDQDKAPETSFSGGDYGGRKSEGGGLIAILSMLKEDVEKEIATSRADDATAQADYAKDRDAAQATLDATTANKVQTENELADLQAKIASYEEYKAQKNGDLDAQKQLEKTLYEDCDWMKKQFASRAEK